MVKSNAGYLAEATRDAITILHWQQASQKLAAELRARVKLHPAVTIQEQHLILKRFSVEVDADLLIAYVSKHYPKHEVECCYEVCCLGFGIYQALTNSGCQVLVVSPADIPRGNKQSTTKTDKVDSAYMAKQLASGASLCAHTKTSAVPQFVQTKK